MAGVISHSFSSDAFFPTKTGRNFRGTASPREEVVKVNGFYERNGGAVLTIDNPRFDSIRHAARGRGLTCLVMALSLERRTRRRS